MVKMCLWWAFYMGNVEAHHHRRWLWHRMLIMMLDSIGTSIKVWVANMRHQHWDLLHVPQRTQPLELASRSRIYIMTLDPIMTSNEACNKGIQPRGSTLTPFTWSPKHSTTQATHWDGMCVCVCVVYLIWIPLSHSSLKIHIRPGVIISTDGFALGTHGW